MSTRQTIDELEDIRLRLYRLRTKNKQAEWFCHGVKAAEVLVVALKKSVEHVAGVTS